MSNNTIIKNSIDHVTHSEERIEYELIRRVVQARKQSGLTQKSLADIIGVTQQEISRFENEKHIPKLSSFIRIIEAIGFELKLEKKNATEISDLKLYYR